LISAAWMTETYRFDEWRGNHGKKVLFYNDKDILRYADTFFNSGNDSELTVFVWSMEAECTSADMFDFACSMFYGGRHFGTVLSIKKRKVLQGFMREIFRGKDLSGVY